MLYKNLIYKLSEGGSETYLREKNIFSIINDEFDINFSFIKSEKVEMPLCSFLLRFFK